MDAGRIYRTLARYNRWMNERLYATAATLSDAERRRDLGAFFRSVHGTLNHLLLTDRVWLGRLGDPAWGVSRDAAGDAIPVTALDQELYADFELLRAERTRTDAHLLTLVEGWDPSHADEMLRWRTMADGAPRAVPRGLALTHLFNHQTHHRGQVTTLLLQLGRDPGVTDLPAMPGAFERG
jgi:uncharacterized damage-inducible protein DinB